MLNNVDEMQWQISNDLVEIHEFNEKGLAEDFKVQGKILSNLSEIDGKFYRYWSPIGHIFAETMIEAGEFYKFRVQLAADYDIGRNWKECH